jgi:hypothetical protein
VVRAIGRCVASIISSIAQNIAFQEPGHYQLGPESLADGVLGCVGGRRAGATPATSFIAGKNGVVIATSRARLEKSLSGLPSRATRAPGREYTLPDGSLMRIMEPSGNAPLRASFTNSRGGPINPFTGKPVQPPSGQSKADRLKYIRDRTHVELGP